MAKKAQRNKTVVTLTHEEMSRKNIPTEEYEADLSLMRLMYLFVPLRNGSGY